MLTEFKIKLDWTLLFLLICPIFYIVNSDLRQSQELFFQVSAFCLVAFMHTNRYVGLFLILVILQSIFLDTVDQGQLLNVLFGAVVYQFIVKCSRVSELKKYMWVLVGILALNIVWCIRQYFNHDPIFSMIEYRNQASISEPCGFFGIPAMLGNYSALVAPLILSLGAWGAFPLAVVGIIFSKSTFSAFAFSCGILFFLWFRKRVFFWIALLVMTVSTAIFAVKYDNPGGQFFRRFQTWEVIENLAFKSPFWGHGLGSLKNELIVEIIPENKVYNLSTLQEFNDLMVSSSLKSGNVEAADFMKANFGRLSAADFKAGIQKLGRDFQFWGEAHNEFLQVFFEMGILGVLIVFGFIADLFKRFWAYGRKDLFSVTMMASFVSILIVSFGHFPFHVARLAGPYLCIIAFLELALNEAKNNRSREWS